MRKKRLKNKVTPKIIEIIPVGDSRNPYEVPIQVYEYVPPKTTYANEYCSCK